MAFGFLEQVLRGDQQPGGGIFGFLQNFSVPARPLARPARGARDFAVGAIRAPGRAAVSTGASIGPHARTIDPEEFGPAGRFFLGSEPVQTLQERQSGLEEGIDESRFRGAAGPLSVLGVGLGTALDITPLGGARKQLAERLAKAKTAKEVEKVLSGQVPNEIVQQVAPAIARTKDPNVIQNIVDRARGLPPSSRLSRPGDTPLPRPDTPPQALNTLDEVTPPAGQGSKVPGGKDVIEGEIVPEPPPVAKDIMEAMYGVPGSKGVPPVKGAIKIRKEQQALYSKARGQKIEASQKAGADIEGSDGYFAELRELEGPLPKKEYSGLAQKHGPEYAEAKFAEGRAYIKAIPDETFSRLGLEPRYARLNTQGALRKVTHGEGGVPQPAELKLLEIAFGKQMADSVKATIPITEQAKTLAAQLYAIPRTLMTSILDLSFGLRQGLVSGARHPVIWAKTNAESVRYMKNEKYHNKKMIEMSNDEAYETIVKDMGMKLPSLRGGHEEVTSAIDIVEKVPLVKRTVRAYDGGATYMRFNIAKKLINAYGGSGKIKEVLSPKELKELGEAIMTGTGRGGKQGGFIDQHAGLLGTTLFSPRLWASRLNTLNPAYYARLSGPAKKEALQSAGAFAAVAGTVLSTIAVTTGAEIETDPRSSDFLKVKFGDTRYDILGGFQQNLVFAWRVLNGESKSSQTGKVSEFRGLADVFGIGEKPDDKFGGPSIPGITADLVGNKLNPLLGSGLRFVEGKDRAGNEIDPYEELLGLFTPLNFQSAYDSYKDKGDPVDALKALPSFFGTGVQTYGVKDIKIAKSDEEYVGKLKGEQADASKLFFQYKKTGPDKDLAGKQIKEALANNNLDEAVKIAKSYNEQYKNTFRDWVSQYNKYTQDEYLVKEYNSGKITDSSLNRWINDIDRRSQQ